MGTEAAWETLSPVSALEAYPLFSRLTALRRTVVWFTVAIFYYLSAWLGVFSSPADSTVSPVWPAAGVAIAACLIFGPRLCLATGLGGSLFTFQVTGSVTAALGAFLANAGEPLLSAWLIRRFIKSGSPLQTPGQVFWFFLFGALIPTGVGSLIGTAFFCLGGQESWAIYGNLVFTWWLGDFMGAVIVAPLLITWFYYWPSQVSSKRAVEAIAMGLVVIVTSCLIFSVHSFPVTHAVGDTADLPLAFLILPILVWAAFRFEQRGATATMLVAVTIAILSMQEPTTKIAAHFPLSRLFIFQYFMGITAMTVMVLAAAVAEQRRSKQVLQAQAAELARSNADLEQFAYVASHDLQEPLRMVASYCQLLERRYQEKLGAEGMELIGHAVRGSLRMKELIQDLLTYSRVGRADEKFTTVDCRDILQSVRTDLSRLISEHRVEIESGALPKIWGHPSQVRILFQNILTNAIKYCEQPTPRISIQAKHEAGGWLLSFEDNGIGIAPEHQQRIFLIFQRLHGRDKYSGTGIGLAICKKIVESHGGRIWVDSQPGNGSTFFVRLPELAIAQRSA